MADRTVTVKLGADSGDFTAAMDKAAAAAEKFAATAEKSSGSVGKAADSVADLGSKAQSGYDKASSAATAAASKVEKARQAEQDAARKVEIAEARLSEVRDSATAKTSQILAAEDRVAAAKQKHEQATDQLAAATKELGAAQEQTASKWDQLTAKVDQYGASMEKVGGALLKFGAAGAAGLTLVSKAAMDWESAWTGVRKTVDGSPEEMAALEGELRQLAKTLPTAHAEIAGVAEAAGQLGIAREDVTKFTKVMLDLGETTNMTAEEAATTLARFSNIMGTSSSDVDRLGSTIVALGNNFATTEGEIAAMGQRLAGAGRAMGLSESQVLALAAAMSSVGIEAEAGGTAMSQFLVKMDRMVNDGKYKLDVLAQVAGVSSAEFKRAFEQDAAGALQMFLAGLGEVQASGGRVTDVLDELEITGIRQSDTIRRLAGASDMLASSLDIADTAWEQNIALVEEATLRYSTTESKVRIAWNNIKDAAISAGEVMLPVIAAIAEAIAGLAQFFGSMPPGMQAVAVGATVVGTGLALVGGAILTLLPKLVAMRVAMKDMNTAFPGIAKNAGKAATALKKIGPAAAGMATAAAMGALLGKAIADLQPKPAPVQEYTNALIALSQGGDNAAESMNKLLDAGVWGEAGTQVTDMTSAFKQLQENMNFVNNSISKMGDALGGMKSAQRQVQEQFKQMDQALASMDATSAVKAFNEIKKSADEAGMSNEDLLATFPEYKARLVDLANQLEVTNLSAQDYVDWMGGKIPEAVLAAAQGNEEAEDAVKRTSSAMRDAAKAAELAEQEYADYMEALQKLADMTLAASDANIAWEQSIDDSRERIKEYRKELEEKYIEEGKSKEQAKQLADQHLKSGKALDIRTEAGRKNQSMINDHIRTGKARIAQIEEEMGAMRDAGASEDELRAKSKELEGAKQQLRDEIARLGREFGMTEDDIAQYIKKLNEVPKEVSTDILLPGAKSTKKQADEINDLIKEMDAQDQIDIIMAFMTDGYEGAISKYRSIQPKTVRVTTEYRNTYTGNTNVGRSGNKDVYLPYADGGPIGGYSPHPKADNLLIRATANEFMMKVASHQKYGTRNLQALNNGEVDPAALTRLVSGRYADGGSVGGGSFGPLVQSPARVNVSAPAVNLDGMTLTGTLDLGGGLEGRMQAVATSTIAGVASELRQAGRRNARSGRGGV